jgi:hypothetical protein
MRQTEPYNKLTRYISFMTGNREIWSGVRPIDNFAAFLAIVPATGVGIFRGFMELVSGHSKRSKTTS